MHAPAPVSVIADAPKARVLLEPLRLRILVEAREPQSAASIAATLGLPRQKVNYHVRELARAGYLRKAGRHKKRGLTEQRWVVSARAYILGDSVLGPMSTASIDTSDKASAAYLLALAGVMRREVGRAWREAHAAAKRLPVLSIDTEVSFRSPDERARFAEALGEAITRVVAEYSSPATSRSSSRPFRVVLGCYPIPPEERT